MMHGFYAGMGGFAFDLSTPDMRSGMPFIPNARRLYVTPRGVQLLARCGLLPCITQRDIRDKSKTDSTGKLICCLQVSWMLIQAISRLAVNLPVTPLEVNTIAHVFCALINYTLWWHKPRWIREPTILTGEWTRPMCAFMYMSSHMSGDMKRDRDFLRDFGVKTEISGVLYVAEPPPPDPKRPCKIRNFSIKSQSSWSSLASVSGYMIPNSTEARVEAQERLARQTTFAEILDNTMRSTRWRLACQALDMFPQLGSRLDTPPCDAKDAEYREARRLYPEMPEKIAEHFRKASVSLADESALYTDLKGGLVCESEELVVDKPRNWPGDDLVRDVQGHIMGIVIWASSIVYGAVHVAAWNERFPTILESWLWRSSAAYLVFSGVLWSLLNLMGHFSGTVWWFWYKILASQKHLKSRVLLYSLCALGGSLYVFARVYLVVEAVVSLRELPASAYQSPNWIISVPHF